MASCNVAQSFSPFRASATAKRGRVVAVSAAQNRSVDRRSALQVLLVPALVALGAKSASAEAGQASQGAEQIVRAVESANAGASDDRKAALRATANEIKSTGKDKDAFPESSFSVPENRQEEGMNPAKAK